MNETFMAAIYIATFDFAPHGDFHLCDGTLLAINQNTALFALMGSAYGGNGSSTFALPDLRGRVPIGYGQGAGLNNSYTIGQKAGVETYSIPAASLPAHTHLLHANSSPATSSDPSGHYFSAIGTDTSVKLYTSVTPNNSMLSSTLSLAGGSAAVSLLRPSVASIYIIATSGNFPSRN